MTTIEDPSEWGHSTNLESNVTKDAGINAVRQLRIESETYLAAISDHMLCQRSTIAAQATSIAEGDKVIDQLHDEIDRLKREATRMMTVIFQANKEMKDMRVDIKALEYNNSLLHERIAEQADQRSHEPTEDELEQADCAPSSMADAFADLIVSARKTGQEQQQVRVNRLARGIKDRINSGHYPLAIAMCEALMESK
jgi:hypothetical protein